MRFHSSLHGLTFRKCETCNSDISICPYNPRPRCNLHRFYKCLICEEKYVDYTHECKLIEHQLECKYHKKFVKIDENVYEDVKSKIKFIHVPDEHSVPSLLKYGDCYVFIKVGEYILRYDTLIGFFARIKHCNNCGTTIGIKRCSGCKAVYYCSPICQTKDYKIHKNKCLAKGLN